MIENLENRQFFAATAALVAGEVQINGTNAADVITIDQATTPAGNPILRVKLNGVTRNFPEAAVKRITARLYGGNDRLIANIAGPNGPMDDGKIFLTALGGNGNDYIAGTNLNDKLLGEIGNDTLMGREGFDRVNGGDGDDRLFGGYENDIMTGGRGRDYVDGEDGEDSILTSGDGASDTIVSDFDYNDIYGTDGFDVFVV
jgi:Ca2+-binding RTX toxin-like protein